MPKKAPLNVAKPIQIIMKPKGIRIDTANDYVDKRILYCLSWVNAKGQAEAIGSVGDRITKKEGVQIVIPNMPPYILDPWNGYMFETEEGAIQGREAIRLYFLETVGAHLENI